MEIDAYPVVVELRVGWGDMDAYQHLNNTVYFRYFEDARIAYFEKMGILTGGIGPILASTSCRFRLPLSYPDAVRAGSRVTKVEEDRFTMEYAVFSERHGKLAAEGEGIIVAYDYGAKKKAAVPEAWREAIARLEG